MLPRTLEGPGTSSRKLACPEIPELTWPLGVRHCCLLPGGQKHVTRIWPESSAFMCACPGPLISPEMCSPGVCSCFHGAQSWSQAGVQVQRCPRQPEPPSLVWWG